MKPPRSSALAVRELYRRRAAGFDRVVALYRLLGVRIARYRSAAIASLGLPPGATVVDLGCGTGAALPALARAVGASGRVVGVDLTDRMLERARCRVERLALANVELVEADLARWRPESSVDGAIAVLSLSLIDEFETVVAATGERLRAGGRLAVVDLQRPAGVPDAWVRLGVRVNRRYGIEPAVLDRPLAATLARHLERVGERRFFGGSVLLWCGERRIRAGG